MKRLVLGILAHVDAGKTTLSEAMLYVSKQRKVLGRVDHGDCFLDTDAQERERGITIFSKQAVMSYGETSFTLLDTPGHADFSAETERALQVLDFAVLVISGTDGVQGHTETLWNLLKRAEIPTFLFINKMDLPGSDRDAILSELRLRLDDACCDFTSPDPEQLATGSESLLNAYLETGELPDWELTDAIRRRRLFPCYFGSALNTDGVQALLDGLDRFTAAPAPLPGFGAQVFKITRDVSGTRLTWLKITGGTLKVKALLTNRGTIGANGRPVPEEDVWEEKADQIRIYSGSKFTTADAAEPGMLCAVTGPARTEAGQGLGLQPPAPLPVLEPVLSYRMILPYGTDPGVVWKQIRVLSEEDPQLHLDWNSEQKEITVRLMGEIQLEILQRLIADRFGLKISFAEGRILYKETIAAPVEGVGHFEPLRHYAEVHLLLQPGESGSGLVFDSSVPTDQLSLNWQRLVLTHLEEKIHRGVLTGAPITDMRITLINGRAHVKHTEGGDFREATYRAVRQGLMCARSVLLEPWYAFRLTLPSECLGRAMNDVQQMGGSFDAPDLSGTSSVLTGRAPVSSMRSYFTEVNAYTRGLGRLSLQLAGYFPCHNTDEVLAEISYFPEADLANTPDSVFCSHGAGTVVPWDRVPEYMHLEAWKPESEEDENADLPVYVPRSRSVSADVNDKELQAIFERTYGAVKRRDFRPQQEVRHEETSVHRGAPVPTGPEYVLVDGYNIIFAWEELKKLAEDDIDAARARLTDILCSYQGYRKCELILVFDAYKVKNNPGSVEKTGGISVVYTKEAETADAYIEKVTLKIGQKHRVRVATSDGLEQVIILGHGALRQSAESFRLDVMQALGEISALIERNNLTPTHSPGDSVRIGKGKR